MLQGVVAVSIIFGAVNVAGGVSLKNSLRVLPMGIVLGLIIPITNFVSNLKIAVVLLIIIGALVSAFVLPMNSLLQHRGHVILSASQSIAAQNFNENANVLFMLGIYSIMIFSELSLDKIIWVFGLFQLLLRLWLWSCIKEQTKQQSKRANRRQKICNYAKLKKFSKYHFHIN